MAKIKSIKHNKQGHTSNSKFAMGDSYGQAVKNKVGRDIESTMSYSSTSPKKLKTPPRSLA
jgi:hypothetical protein